VKLLLIAAAEWRYWMRSRLALSGALLLAILLLATTVLTTLRMHDERAERSHHQAEAAQQRCGDVPTEGHAELGQSACAKVQKVNNCPGRISYRRVHRDCDSHRTCIVQSN
jgi:hypothetical protein